MSASAGPSNPMNSARADLAGARLAVCRTLPPLPLLAHPGPHQTRDVLGVGVEAVAGLHADDGPAVRGVVEGCLRLDLHGADLGHLRPSRSAAARAPARA